MYQQIGRSNQVEIAFLMRELLQYWIRLTTRVQFMPIAEWRLDKTETSLVTHGKTEKSSIHNPA